MFSYLRNRRLLALLGLLILATVIGVAHNHAANKGHSLAIEDGSRIILRPFQLIGAKIGSGTGAVLRSFRTRSSLLRENKRLRADIRKLTYENSLLRDAAEQNLRLRRALDFKSSFPLPLISARIIGREASGWFSTCIIDRGTRDSIRPGFAVATSRGLAGQIFKVSPTSSIVLMLSDSSTSIGAIDQRSRVNGICQGQNSDVLLLNYLAKDSDVKVGDVIVSSGIGLLVPKGLPIGRVVKLEPDPGGFTKHALLRPSATFDELEEVFVVVRAVEE